MLFLCLKRRHIPIARRVRSTLYLIHYNLAEVALPLSKLSRTCPPSIHWSHDPLLPLCLPIIGRSVALHYS